MHPSTAFTGAAVLLTFAPSVMALGAASVVNNCGTPIYYASVSQGQSGSMQEIDGSYTEQYGQPGDGVSIKLAPSDDLSGPVSQFELTVSGSSIFWDLSNINGYPFSQDGMQVVPSMQHDPANPTCIPVTCPAGETTCSAAYNDPDDTRTMVCNANSDLTLTLCPSGSSNSSSAGRWTRRDDRGLAHVHHRVHSRQFR